MCGIWASINLAPSRDVINTVAHRGPDGEGWEEFNSPRGSVVLAHRRLAIIDTSDAGRQPMAYENARYWLSYNGEIYNYLELRKELRALGYAFATETDSEVLLAAYAEWGQESLRRLNGMFAFVIWDDEEKTLFVARDRFGIKPLYYSNTSIGLALASEIKQFSCLSNFKPYLNLQRGYDFLTAGLFDHTDETLFTDVFQLRGGESFFLRLEQWSIGQPLAIRRWYNLPLPNSLTRQEEEAANHYAELLANAVNLQLRADVPVGSCLSGGLDSSSIVCLVARHLKATGLTDQQYTFSAVYDDQSVDERPFIEEVAATTDIRSHYVFPNPDALLEQLERIIWHQDEPFGSTSIYAQWEVFQLAAKTGIKVMLDGQGADEQLGGYHFMFGTYHAGLLRSLQFGRLWSELVGQQRRHGVTRHRQLRSLTSSLLPEASLELYLRFRHGRVAPKWISTKAWRGCTLYRSPVPTVLAQDGLPPIRDLGDYCRAQTISINLPMLLHYEDRSSMAHSVEARVPFLDHRLVEFAIALGSEHKIVGGETKRLLRRAMDGILPEKIRDRSDKLGFPTPERKWLCHQIRPFVIDQIGRLLTRFPDLFNDSVARQWANEKLEGRGEFDFALWRLVSFALWAEKFDITY